MYAVFSLASSSKTTFPFLGLGASCIVSLFEHLEVPMPIALNTLPSHKYTENTDDKTMHKGTDNSSKKFKRKWAHSCRYELVNSNICCLQSDEMQCLQKQSLSN